jgi:transcriptional regulator with XRE-family HTH domain
MEVAERIFVLMEERGISAAQLTRDVPLTSGVTSQWKKGLQKPSADAVIKIAQYFNVTTDYIYGLSDDPTPPLSRLAVASEQLQTSLDLAYEVKKKLEPAPGAGSNVELQNALNGLTAGELLKVKEYAELIKRGRS